MSIFDSDDWRNLIAIMTIILCIVAIVILTMNFGIEESREINSGIINLITLILLSYFSQKSSEKSLRNSNGIKYLELINEQMQTITKLQEELLYMKGDKKDG